MERTTSTLDEEQFSQTLNGVFNRREVGTALAQAQPDVQWANGYEYDGQSQRFRVGQSVLRGVR